MNLIVGLGNPGKKYENTRHNVGFMAVDSIAKRLGLNWENNKKFNALICIHNNVIHIKPQTFMNNSGQAVQVIMSYYKLLPKKFGILKEKNSDLSETLTVIHDDIDIELGKIKTSVDSRSAGHNGVESIINYLKTKNFKRVRIGIRTESLNKITAEKFVLQKFNQEELQIINKLILGISLA
ncbi:MAG: aminoacyl-tRNA hydrolase [Patescibacteria group bacterium]|nr:aminoacyl-tRNA hydrolase [bacterium]